MSSETVRVGCRLVNGVRLRMFAPVYDADTALSPLKFTGEEIVLNGTKSDTDTSRVRGQSSGDAAGMTDVPRAFWEAWKPANADSPLLANGIIFEIEGSATPA